MRSIITILLALLISTTAAMAAVTIKLRGDTAANWTSNNPVLALREPGVETDTSKIKIGDGVTAWASLPYSAGGGGTTSIQMTFVSDSALATQTGSKTKVPTGIAFTTADIGCNASDTLTVSLMSSPTVNGTYSQVGTVSLTAASSIEGVDISAWNNISANTWVRIDITSAGSAATECTVAIGGTEL